MKLFIAGLFVFLGSQAMATEIITAGFDAKSKTISLELAFIGGTKPHNFSLEYEPCRVLNGNYEVAARLLDEGHDDLGQQELFQTVEFSVADLACKPAWLTVRSGRFSHKTLWIY